MYAELQQYLIFHRNLPVPGIGTFFLEQSPAVADLPNRVIHAPSYLVKHKSEVDSLPKHFFSWLGHVLGIPDREAQSLFEEFGHRMADDTRAGKIIRWHGVGEIKSNEGQLQFNGYSFSDENAVAAYKVIRENAQHQVRVGEDVRSSDEMTRMLKTEVKTRKYSLLIPLIIFLLAIAYITWYFLQNGFTPYVR
jgi:hypothetical protein